SRVSGSGSAASSAGMMPREEGNEDAEPEQRDAQEQGDDGWLVEPPGMLASKVHPHDPVGIALVRGTRVGDFHRGPAHRSRRRTTAQRTPKIRLTTNQQPRMMAMALMASLLLAFSRRGASDWPP